ncbi:MAG: N-acetylglucosaminyl-diphospho-decaprenol L-rhamnosyltransferase [Microgenomates group bacterium ADurb.Bin238]|jgi:GT2 family glycosyltransferase|nr:MAG: N-acetylglucosaminyl-diphospho-decaprenol L-rhamnosyltransferase [Microgenomates group bacterium ADurb.Bin238]
MSTDKRPLDILIVTYNSEKFIQHLISDLSESKVVNKILIYDNNSNDRTRSIIEKHKTSKVITFFGDKNIGFAKAMNILVKNSKTEYQILVNPDIKLKNHAIEILLKCAIRQKSDIAGGAMIGEDGSIQRSFTRIPTPMTILFEFTNLKKIFPNNRWHKNFLYKDISYPKHSIEVGSVSGGYMLIKKSSFELLHGFDENFFMYLEDVDICKRAHQNNMKVIYCPNSRVFHSGGGSSNNKHRIHYSAWDKARMWYIKKNHKTPKTLSQILTLAIKGDILITRMRREKHVD